MYPNGATCLPEVCCFSYHYKKPATGCWSSTKWISSSTHRNITCTLGIKQQPITQFFNLATDLQNNRTMNESGSKNLQHNRIMNESESKNYHIIEIMTTIKIDSSKLNKQKIQTAQKIM